MYWNAIFQHTHLCLCLVFWDLMMTCFTASQWSERYILPPETDSNNCLRVAQITPKSSDKAVHLPNWAPWGQNQPKQNLTRSRIFPSASIFFCLIMTPWSSIWQMNSFVTWFRCNLGHPKLPVYLFESDWPLHDISSNVTMLNWKIFYGILQGEDLFD